MQFGGIIATDAMKTQEDKRVKDLSKSSPLKSGFGGVIATSDMALPSRRDNDVAQECPDCDGFGYHFNNDLQLGESCSNCIQGWVIKDSDDVISTLTDDETFEKGVKLGAGVAVGFSLVSLGIGLTAGVLGLIYERVTGE
jgi:hypothetical protein